MFPEIKNAINNILSAVTRPFGNHPQPNPSWKPDWIQVVPLQPNGLPGKPGTGVTFTGPNAQSEANKMDPYTDPKNFVGNRYVGTPLTPSMGGLPRLAQAIFHPQVFPGGPIQGNTTPLQGSRPLLQPQPQGGIQGNPGPLQLQATSQPSNMIRIVR